MIRKYNNIYFEEIYQITKNIWKDEFNFDEELTNFIYQFLVRYYLLNEKLSFVDYSNQVDAFIFSALKTDTNDYINWFKKNLNQLKKQNRASAKTYLNYLEYNHHKILNHMNENDLNITLFASIKKGSGKKLLNYVENLAKINHQNIILWTDETCNHQYYQKLGYQIVEEYIVDIYNKQIKTYIYKLEG